MAKRYSLTKSQGYRLHDRKTEKSRHYVINERNSCESSIMKIINYIHSKRISFKDIHLTSSFSKSDKSLLMKKLNS